MYCMRTHAPCKLTNPPTPYQFIVQVNNVIELPSNSDSRKFPLQLEYAMPKLKKETSGGFDRLKSQISTDTTLTELQDHGEGNKQSAVMLLGAGLFIVQCG